MVWLQDKSEVHKFSRDFASLQIADAPPVSPSWRDLRSKWWSNQAIF